MIAARHQLIIEPTGGDNDMLRTALAAARLPTDDLTGPGRTFFRFRDGGKTVGFGGHRPFVISPIGTRLSQPSEVVLGILPDNHKGAFTKEDGERVLDAEGKRVV